MGIATDPAREINSKIEVLQDLEEKVGELMEAHERKRGALVPVGPHGTGPGRMPGYPPGHPPRARPRESPIMPGPRSR